MAGGRVGNMVFADEMQAAGDELLVVVFLRGGCDGLSLVAPYDDPVYVEARGNIAIPTSGDQAAITLNPNNPTFTSSLGLHPSAGPLKELYDARKLAVVHACGLNDDTRSHFDAMDFMERGVPGNKHMATGWLARHLQSAQPTGLLPTLAAGAATPASLLGEEDAVAMTDARNFGLSTHWRYSDTGLRYNMLHTVKQFYTGTGAIETAGQRTIEVIESFDNRDLNYAAANGASYPGGSFGDTLRLVAQTVKLDVGLRIATVDFGGWDTHESQGNAGTGYFANQIDTLSRGLHAFYTDMSDHHGRLTMVVMSEFGRRLGVNSSGGTDHGHGNLMLVLGGNVNGGTVYGRWPGLQDLDQGQDLRITTDYRTVLSEVIVRRLGNPNLYTVFPGLTSYTPLGVVSGTDLPIDLTPPAPGAHRVYLPYMRR